MLHDAYENGTIHIETKEVKMLPKCFRSFHQAGVMKYLLVWRAPEQFVDTESNIKLRETTFSFTRVKRDGIKHIDEKAPSGRGRKRQPWVLQLHKICFLNLIDFVVLE